MLLRLPQQHFLFLFEPLLHSFCSIFISFCERHKNASLHQQLENNCRYTPAILKPDVASSLEEKRGQTLHQPLLKIIFCWSILNRIEQSGFRIVCGSPSSTHHSSPEDAERSYAEHRGRFFYSSNLSITSGPINPFGFREKIGTNYEPKRRCDNFHGESFSVLQ